MSLLRLHDCVLPDGASPPLSLELEGPRALWSPSDPQWIELALGLARPRAGRLELAGRDPQTHPPLHAAPAHRLPPRMHALEWLVWCMRLQGCARQEAERRAAEQLTRFGVAAQAKRPLRSASSVLRALLPLAAALAHPDAERPIVLGDVGEPLVDAEARWLGQRFGELATERSWLAVMPHGPMAQALAPFASPLSEHAERAEPATRSIAVIARGTPSAWQQLLAETPLTPVRIEPHAQGAALWLELRSGQDDAQLFSLAAAHGLSIIEWLPSAAPAPFAPAAAE